MSGLLPIVNILLTIFNIFCTAFLSLLWIISHFYLSSWWESNPLTIIFLLTFISLGLWLCLIINGSISRWQQLHKKQGLYYEDLNNNIKEVIKTIPEDYYKKILNRTYNRQKDYIKKNKVRKYKNYKD